jgi:hypothetical protein
MGDTKRRSRRQKQPARPWDPRPSEDGVVKLAKAGVKLAVAIVALAAAIHDFL